MKMLFGMIVIAVAMAGCASVPQDRASLILTRCPALKTYTPEQMKKAAATLKNLPDDDEVAEMLADYSKMRQACRVAIRQLKKTTNQ